MLASLLRTRPSETPSSHMIPRTRKLVVSMVAGLCLLAPLSASALSSEIHFAADGTFSAKNILVYQKAGGNLFCRGTWDTAFIRFVVITSPSTVITKDHGERATAADIADKDIISVEGKLATGGDSIVVNASSIEDSSLQTSTKSLSGTVSKIDTASRTLTLATKDFGSVSVSVGGASITKGVRTITLGDISAGDKITAASGVYDYSTNTLTATSLEVYQDKTVFAPRNFQGTLKSISGTTLPVTLVVSAEGKDYTVYVPASGAVLKSSRAAASLSRFLAGDTVRFYGTVRPTNLSEVDAEVIRDLNF